jgi:diguanylate cyclase (GGDEF)-like protein
MNPYFRERWALVAGAASAAATLFVFRLAGVRSIDVTVLGVVADGWGLAMFVLACFLALQLLLNSRVSLHRERRLVETAAALREATARSEDTAAHDPLTGVLNRGGLRDELGPELRRSRRYGRPLSLLMIDLDHFKGVNDEHGHPFGDLVLIDVAHTISSNVRESDIVARYGGEEFVVVLTETDLRGSTRVAEKLRLQISSRTTAHRGVSDRITVSVGVAELAPHGLEGEAALIERADHALYEAKRAGRNRVVASRWEDAIAASA